MSENEAHAGDAFTPACKALCRRACIESADARAEEIAKAIEREATFPQGDRDRKQSLLAAAGIASSFISKPEKPKTGDKTIELNWNQVGERALTADECRANGWPDGSWIKWDRSGFTITLSSNHAAQSAGGRSGGAPDAAGARKTREQALEEALREMPKRLREHAHAARENDSIVEAGLYKAAAVDIEHASRRALEWKP